MGITSLHRTGGPPRMPSAGPTYPQGGRSQPFVLVGRRLWMNAAFPSCNGAAAPDTAIVRRDDARAGNDPDGCEGVERWKPGFSISAPFANNGSPTNWRA